MICNSSVVFQNFAFGHSEQPCPAAAHLRYTEMVSAVTMVTGVAPGALCSAGSFGGLAASTKAMQAAIAHQARAELEASGALVKQTLQIPDSR